jgi:beta-glucosidase
MSSINISKLLSEMTLEEKAGLCSGADFWHTKAVERLGLPAVMVSDGPHGLRKQDNSGDHVGLLGSVKAVCFPAACALSCSFDRELAYTLVPH